MIAAFFLGRRGRVAAQVLRPYGMKSANTFVLVHSPLVGSLTWALVADELDRRGINSVVPSFSDVLDDGPPFWQHIAEHVHQEVRDAGMDEPLVLVGHSGAGPLLPAIRERLAQRVTGYLFVDARLPKNGTSFFDDAPPGTVQALRTRVRQGSLPNWADWFGEEAMRSVLPDGIIRRRFIEELRPIPLALLEEPVPVSASWDDAPCGYIRLSRVYESQIEMARDAGWQTRVLEGGHLHMLVDPVTVTDVILEITQRMSGG